jgi:predicted RNase H-like nuclease (RuvC/YqgF family)
MMKKWMNYMAIIGLAAGTASAAWWPFGSDKKAEPAPSTPAKVVPATSAAAPEASHMQRPEGKGERRVQLSPEQKEKMKARHEELKKLGEAARNETDPAKKEVLIGQLRAKLTAMADERQAEMKKRIDSAEKEMPKLKEKMAAAEKNKSANIEKQVQRILAGEPIEQPKGAQKKEGKKGKKAPAAE